MTKKQVIGCDNKIPWHIPDDFKLFKKKTLGGVVIMGRKTFESIGHPLPRRENIIISKTLKQGEGFVVVENFNQAITKAREYGKEIFVIGGSRVYKEGLLIADKLCISWVKKYYPGNVFFPVINWNEWELAFSEEHEEFTYCEYLRKRTC